jgi:ATP-dependent DNA helicase DinG
MAPVDVAAVLRSRLWADADEGPRTVVLTSATIPSALPERLGLPRETFEQLDVGSPFDFEHHALLYCAAHLPDPRKPDYEDALHAELEALLRAAGGRTLALFTSWRAMRAAAEHLRDRVPWRVLTQDELPKPALVTAFAGDETSCLFATMGFWQGLDVPGRALSMVVIDRIPFPRPDEPLTQARRDRAGAAAFRTVDLPRAATLLAQGAGRLIRSATDRGVCAILDRRVLSKRYGRGFIDSLPPCAEIRGPIADLGRDAADWLARPRQ